MKQLLIVIRGAPASGKTTLGQNLRNEKEKIVWLKTDNFKPFFSESGEFSEVISQTALASLSYLLDHGYSVIYEGIFQNPEFAQAAVKLARTKNIPVVAYQLVCSLEILQQRDKARPGIKEGCRKPLGDETIKNIFNTIENAPISGAVKLDTGKLSINECLEIIKKNLKEKSKSF